MSGILTVVLMVNKNFDWPYFELDSSYYPKEYQEAFLSGFENSILSASNL
jgi:hypothetical protein